MKKRALSLFLAVVMTLGLAAPAFGAEEPFMAEESAAQEDTAPAPAVPEAPLPAEPVPAEAEPAEEPAAPDMPAPASVTEPEAADLPAPASAGSFEIYLTKETGIDEGPVEGWGINQGESFDAALSRLAGYMSDPNAAYTVKVILSGDVTTNGLTWDKNAALYIYAGPAGATFTGNITVSAGTVCLGSAMDPYEPTGPLTVIGDVTVSGGSATLNSGTYSHSLVVGNGGTLTCGGSSSIGTMFINADGHAVLNGGNLNGVYVRANGTLTGSDDVQVKSVTIESETDTTPVTAVLSGGTYDEINVEGPGAYLTCSGAVNVGSLNLSFNKGSASTKNVKLSGGTFGMIEIKTVVGILAEVLEGGFCYANTADHYMITDNDLLNTLGGDISGVTVMKVPSYTPPQANSLTYSGRTQALVTAGSSGMQYALKETEPAEGEWKNNINSLTGVNAGGYRVWWRVKPGTDGVTAGVKGDFVVTIVPASVTTTMPTLAGTMVYNGRAQRLLTAPGSVTNNGKMLYTTGDAFHPLEAWVDFNGLTRTDAGDYFIWYKVEADANHGGVEPDLVSYSPVTIEERAVTVNWSGDNFVYDGMPHAPTATLSGVLSGDKNDVQVAVSVDDNVQVGYCIAFAELTGPKSKNYEIISGSSQSFHINKAARAITPPAALDRVYDWQSTALVTAGSVSGGTILYSLTGENYTTEIPTNELGNADKVYTVYWKAETDAKNYDYGAAEPGSMPTAKVRFAHQPHSAHCRFSLPVGMQIQNERPAERRVFCSVQPLSGKGGSRRFIYLS